MKLIGAKNIAGKWISILPLAKTWFFNFSSSEPSKIVISPLTHYLGSKSQRLEGERTRGVIICRGKLQLSVMFVLWQTWQNGGEKKIHLFHKTEGSLLSSLSCERLWNPQSTSLFFFFKSKLGGNESELQLWSKPGGIKGIHMTTVHFQTITATVMAVIGWIGPLISLMHHVF